MELKHVNVFCLPCKAEVLIEPLWNWNLLKPCIGDGGTIVLIEPLWNWNKKWWWKNRWWWKSLNRTFMELKLSRNTRWSDAAEVLIEPLWNWNTVPWSLYGFWNMSLNRTFMELKHENLLWNVPCCPALIEPLWNWNLHLNLMLCPVARLNRTFMELKLHGDEQWIIVQWS